MSKKWEEHCIVFTYENPDGEIVADRTPMWQHGPAYAVLQQAKSLGCKWAQDVEYPPKPDEYPCCEFAW